MEKEIGTGSDPDIHRDVLETVIKFIFRDVLNIKRMIPLTHVYRFEDKPQTLCQPLAPVVVGFLKMRDRENILPQCASSKALKDSGIYVTEDVKNTNMLRPGFARPPSPSKTVKPSSKRSPLKSAKSLHSLLF